MSELSTTTIEPLHNQKLSWGEQRSYGSVEEGQIYATSVFTEQGEELVWRDHHDTNLLGRQIMLTTESGQQYYVRGDRIFDMSASKAQGRVVSVEMPVDGLLPDATIGESWTTPLGVTEPISKVEVLRQKVDSSDYAALKILDEYPLSDEQNDFAEALSWLTPFRPAQGYTLPQSRAKEHVDKAGEVVKATAALSKKALDRAAQRGIAVAKGVAYVSKGATVWTVKQSAKMAELVAAKSAEAYSKGVEWTAEKYVELGAFTTALCAQMPDIIEAHKALNAIDEDFEQYEKRDLLKKIGHRALIGSFVFLELDAKATQAAWKKRKIGSAAP